MRKKNNILFDKLNAFIRKYYANLLIKGAILFGALFALNLLVISLLEHYAWYGPVVREILFFSWLFISLILFIFYIVLPVSKLFNLGKTLSVNEAAKIIGRHFPDVSDKLINAIQLIESDKNDALLLAAVEQKTKQISPVPFNNAIKFKSNLKYVKFAIWPVAVLSVILIVSPALIIDSSKRVLLYNQTFEKPAPFVFSVQNKKLETEQFGDFDLEVIVTGSILPNDAYIELDGKLFKLQKKSKTTFVYEFKNLQKDITFKLFADEFYSQPYQLKVLSKPILLQYSATIIYPAYLGQKSTTLNNPSDITLPAGSTIKWQFRTKQTDNLNVCFNNFCAAAEKLNETTFTYAKKVFVNSNYTIKSINNASLLVDSITYQMQVIPDNYPEIEVTQRIDSLYSKLIYFGGKASDDYGLTRLTFNYKFTKGKKAESGLKSIEVPINKDKQLTFFYQFNLYEIGFETGDELIYYFEVWDNDGVFKPKSTKSNLINLKAPDKEMLKQQSESNSKQLESKMQEALKEVANLQKELAGLQRQMQNNQPLNWEEKRKAEELLKRQKELTRKIEELQKDFKQKNIREQEFKEEDKRIIEKQLQLEKMYNEILNEEMKKQMQQLEKMLQMQNKDQINKELNKLELNNKDVEKELDRMLELYKQLEVEKKMQDAIKDLQDLAKKQMELSEKTLDKQSDKNDLQKQQEDLNKSFEEIRKDLSKIEEENKTLQNPKDLPDTKEEQKSIEYKMNQSADELSKGNQKKAAQQQKQAAEEMEKLKEKMEQQMEKEEEEQNEEDANTLREILENLIQLSKDQEDLMQDFKKINGYNPQFVEMAKVQKNLKDNAKIVEDSLLALSKRNPQVKAFINREVSKMNDYLQRSIKGFSDRNFNDIRVNQQYAMTSMNNLAVMLSDALKQMQNQSQSKKSGKQGGKKKGGKSGSKPSMSELKKMQEQLNKQLREGLNKNGSGEKGQLSSEQFARMAAQQMAIRQQLQKLMQQMDALQKQQMGGSKELNELQQLMQETEKELVNKRLTQQTLMRQQEILTRLLEHEKAEKKQDEEQKREGEQGKQYPKPSPKYFEDLKQKQQQQTELLKTVPANMKPYYRDKAKQYLQ